MPNRLLGGSSPTVNPQVAFATFRGTDNILPSFIEAGNGPVREARFVKNARRQPGWRRALAVHYSRYAPTRPGCVLAQPDFATAVGERQCHLPDSHTGIRCRPDRADPGFHHSGQSSEPTPRTKRTLGIRGRPNIVLSGNAVTGQPNHNGNDGTAARFGWKAQNKSLLLFSGEAYNVEMGITNELFQTERDETPRCQFAATPNDTINADANAVDAVGHREVCGLHALPRTTDAFAHLPGGSHVDCKGQSSSAVLGAPNATRRRS